jgi:FK506-binding nuclear protein
VLTVSQQYQQTLDFTVGEEEEVMFIVKGNYDVSLSGNYVVPLDSLKGGDEDSDYESEEDSDYDQSPDEDELMDLLKGREDSEDELDDVDHPRITEVESEDEKKKPEPKKLTKAEKKNLKRAAEEEGKEAVAFTVWYLLITFQPSPRSPSSQRSSRRS